MRFYLIRITIARNNFQLEQKVFLEISQVLTLLKLDYFVLQIRILVFSNLKTGMKFWGVYNRS